MTDKPKPPKRVDGQPRPRVHIPSPCWARHPDPKLADRCTEPPGHKNRHYDWSTGREWPNRGNDPQ